MPLPRGSDELPLVYGLVLALPGAPFALRRQLPACLGARIPELQPWGEPGFAALFLVGASLGRDAQPASAARLSMTSPFRPISRPTMMRSSPPLRGGVLMGADSVLIVTFWGEMASRLLNPPSARFARLAGPPSAAGSRAALAAGGAVRHRSDGSCHRFAFVENLLAAMIFGAMAALWIFGESGGAVFFIRPRSAYRGAVKFGLAL
jgi:hypothetical protein